MSKHFKKIMTQPQSTTTSLTLEDAYSKFILRCRTMNLSESTLKYYQENWNIFA